MIFDRSKGRMRIQVTAATAAMLLAITFSACKKEPNLTGKWAATGKTMENGEQKRDILDLKQEGTQIAGTVRNLGGKTNVKGTANGAHFELWGVGGNDKKPFLVGDLNDGTIQYKEWGDNFTAKPDTA